MQNLTCDGMRGSPLEEGVRQGDSKVFENRQIVQDGRVLIGDRDPERGRCFGRHRRHAPAFDLDLATVRLINAGYDVHQRRLASTVLAENGMDLAGIELDADVLERCYPGIELRNPGHADGDRSVGGAGRLDRGHFAGFKGQGVHPLSTTLQKCAARDAGVPGRKDITA